MKKRKEHGNYDLEFGVEGMEENMETVIWSLGLGDWKNKLKLLCYCVVYLLKGSRLSQN